MCIILFAHGNIAFSVAYIICIHVHAHNLVMYAQPSNTTEIDCSLIIWSVAKLPNTCHSKIETSLTAAEVVPVG